MVPALMSRGRAGRSGSSRPRSLPALLPVLLSAWLLGGCGGPEPSVRDYYYTLEPPISVTPSAHRLNATLLVNELAARGFVGGSQIVFREADAPLEARRYNDYLWEESPARAIAEDLVSALRAARVFDYVVTVTDRAHADYLLGGELTRFEHLPTSEPPRVAAEWTLTLVDGRERDTRFSKTYAGEEPTQGHSAEAMAMAFNRLTARLIGQAVRDLQTLAPRLRGGA